MDARIISTAIFIAYIHSKGHRQSNISRLGLSLSKINTFSSFCNETFLFDTHNARARTCQNSRLLLNGVVIA